MIELRLLKRDWKSGQIQLIAAALILAVAVVAAVAILAERVQQGLSREVSSFLAADIKIQSGIELDEVYAQKAKTFGLNTAQIAEFGSMVFHGDNNHLASVKAVSNAYPLRGKLTISNKAFAQDDASWKILASGPKAGEAWVEERLLPILGMQLGDEIEVGKQKLTVTKVIINEPDRGGGFSMIGARLIMNYADLTATGVIQPGSRVQFGLLAAGNNEQVVNLSSWAQNYKNEHVRIILPEEASEQLSDALERGESFLLLAGTVGILLAAIALALSSQRYAERHKNQIALMKSWGQSSREIRKLMLTQLSLLGIICTLVGLIVGWLVHAGLLWAIQDLLPQQLPAAGSSAYLTAILTGFLCLLGFALPSLWHLPDIAPLRVLRRDIDTNALSSGLRFSIAIFILVLILYWYSQSISMSLIFLGGIFLTASLLSTLVFVLMSLLKSITKKTGSSWRLAMANLWRRKWLSIMQMIAFTLAIMLMLIMTSMRTSLLEDWQTQLPEDTPNYFLVNVAPWEVDPVKDLMRQHALKDVGWYPMVRGRLVSQNGETITQERLEKVGGLDREVNLTWTKTLPDTNEIVAGEWWTQQGQAEFSMEEKVAKELGVKLGDKIGFSLGGRELEATLTSIRTVDWDSMKPNFFIIFPEGVLEDYSPNWITSTYLQRQDKPFINALLTEYPTVLVIALDEIINRIRLVIDRVTTGLELMLLMVLACGILVLFAAIATSYDERARESAILRTLGSSRKLVLSVVGIEFAFMGLISGLIAAIGAQLAVFGFQLYVFKISLVWYPWLWLVGPMAGILIVTSLGLLRSYPIIITPPLQSLRQLN